MKVEELLPQVNELTPADDPKMVELCHFSDIVEEYETENHPVGSKTVNDNGLSGNPFEKFSRFAGAWKDNVEYASEYLERESAPTFSADKLFFTADTHFGHANIIKYCHRPFASVAEMDEVLVRNWNEVVSPDATVFHLGDFALDSKKRWRELFGQLNGKKKYLILGNHDRRRILDDYDPGFTEIFDRTCINVDGQLVILNHTPLDTVDSEFWNFKSEAWQFYGHVHSGPLNTDNKAAPLIKSLLPTQYDVGVDNNSFKPVSFEQIKQTIESQL